MGRVKGEINPAKGIVLGIVWGMLLAIISSQLKIVIWAFFERYDPMIGSWWHVHVIFQTIIGSSILPEFDWLDSRAIGIRGQSMVGLFLPKLAPIKPLHELNCQFSSIRTIVYEPSLWHVITRVTWGRESIRLCLSANDQTKVNLHFNGMDLIRSNSSYTKQKELRFDSQKSYFYVHTSS